MEIEKPRGDDRREFLKKSGKFAVITPATVTFLLSTSMTSKAIAKSSGRPGKGQGRPGKGKGDVKHGHSGPPGLAKKGL